VTVPGRPGDDIPVGTLKAILRSAGEAIQGRLETLRQFGDPVPAPSSLVAEVEITTAA
jgi:predicted RNase H-like HicB family nuclease